MWDFGDINAATETMLNWPVIINSGTYSRNSGKFYVFKQYWRVTFRSHTDLLICKKGVAFSGLWLVVLYKVLSDDY